MAKQQPSQRVTRADVARLAGTSVAVVSYVINNGPRPVAEKTRQRVLDVIQRIGYRPNGVARALALGSTKTFGLIVPSIANPFVASMAHVLLQESMKAGHVMLLGDAGEDRQCEIEVIHALLNRQVDGLFYASVDSDPQIDLIKASGTPLIMLDRADPQAGVSVLRVDERRAARRLTEHLLGHGYREVGILCGPPEMVNARDRVNGWRDAMQAQGLTINESWIWPARYHRDDGYAVMRQILQQDTVPRALFVSNEAQAIGCLRALAEQNIRVPEQLALVCFNGTDLAAFQQPKLTTVRQHIHELAETAIEMLINWDNMGEVREISYYMEMGASCGCALNAEE